MHKRARRCLLWLVSSALVIAGCADGHRLPTSPSAAAAAVPGTASMPIRFIAVPEAGSGAIAFPPRNEPVMFREALNTKYQGRGSGLSSSFVNAEGSVVWIQEYLRYRVNGCSHADAMTRVFQQLANPTNIAAVCGEQAAGTVTFPPRDQSRAFRDELEVRYRDQLGASATSSFVNIEGDIVWIQEYLRYRVNGCGHDVATTKVFLQIDGAGVQPIDEACGNRAEVVAIITGASLPFNTNASITFSGLSSHSNRGRIVSYSWDCGQPANTSCKSTSATPTFRYLRTGPLGTRVDYRLTLDVVDEQGNRANTAVTVTLIQAY
jgi:hypothetical protein